MGNIITREERDLIAKLRLVAGEKTAKLSDDELMEVIEQGRREMLERAAVLSSAYATAIQQGKFNVFVENLDYGRIITKIRFNEDNKRIEAFVVESVEGVDAKYWTDIDQLSGPELLGLGDRVQLLLETLEYDDEAA
jgi:hypothetical protein